MTTYGRAATLSRRRPADLALLAAAGLTRVHIGMESGADSVLARVEKGCTAAQLVKAGRQVLEAGMELCFYVMPGLGGRDLAAAHVRGTADVLREVAAAAVPERPLVVRLRTTAVVPGTPLAADEAAGRFTLPDDVEVAAELRALLVRLDGVRLELRSDHALNLLPGLEGSLPADRELLIAMLDELPGTAAEPTGRVRPGRSRGSVSRAADSARRATAEPPRRHHGRREPSRREARGRQTHQGAVSLRPRQGERRTPAACWPPRFGRAPDVPSSRPCRRR